MIKINYIFFYVILFRIDILIFDINKRNYIFEEICKYVNDK